MRYEVPDPCEICPTTGLDFKQNVIHPTQYIANTGLYSILPFSPLVLARTL